MMAMLGRCPKCRQITDDWDGKTTKIKGITNVYKVDNLLCDDCGDLGSGIMFTVFTGLLSPKELDNVIKQHEELYKEFLNKKLTGEQNVYFYPKKR